MRTPFFSKSNTALRRFGLSVATAVVILICLLCVLRGVEQWRLHQRVSHERAFLLRARAWQRAEAGKAGAILSIAKGHPEKRATLLPLIAAGNDKAILAYALSAADPAELRRGVQQAADLGNGQALFWLDAQEHPGLPDTAENRAAALRRVTPQLRQKAREGKSAAVFWLFATHQAPRNTLMPLALAGDARAQLLIALGQKDPGKNNDG